MSLFIRCRWLPDPTHALEGRIGEIVTLLRSEVVERLTGSRWHGLAMSRAAALRDRVDLNATRAWRKVPLTTTQVMHRLGLWNGADEALSASLSATVYEPSEEPDILVFSTSDCQSLEASETRWADVLAVAEAFANQLGGRAIVSSNELLEWAAQRNVEHADVAAYAAYWGVDRSGANPCYEWIPKDHRGSPSCEVACTTWAEAASPSEERLANLVRLLRVSQP